MSILKNKIIFLSFLILTMFSCSITKQIEHDLANQSDINNYFRGLVVYNTKTNKEIINFNGAKYFTPASNTKLFTFYSAYKTFKDSVTGFEYEIKKDSLIIRGTADPSFLYGFDESKSLDFLKSAEQNIYLINEDISEKIYGPGWAWDDYPYYYMPEKSLFPIYGNIVELNKKGNNISIKPKFFEGDIELNNSKKNVRDNFSNTFYINSDKDIHEKNIPFKTSNQLVADLLGDEIGKKITLIPNKKTYKFNSFKSVKYDSLYKVLLQISDNFIAEQLMLQVGNKVANEFSVKKGIDYSLDNYFQGIPQKPRWVDGSGLSRYNLFTPESYVFLLKKMYHEIPKEKLFGYFPAGGESGTLKKYFKNDKLYVFAKSGTLSNNYSLSGYLITKKGTVLIFSFMNNHYQGSSVERKKEMQEYFLKLYEKY